MACDDVLGRDGAPIAWADAKLAAALSQLELALDGQPLPIDSPWLAAAFVQRHEDPEQALDAMERTASWRETSGAMEARRKISEDPQLRFLDFPFGQEVLKYLPQCEGGLATDQRNLPYAIRCPGLADANGLFSSITEDDLLLFQIYLNEWRLYQLEGHARSTGHFCGILIVQDMFAPEGLLNAWRKQGKKAGVMRKVTSMMDEHYPGIMEEVLLVNAPWALHALMKVIAPLLPPRIVRKIQFIPMDQTPTRLKEKIGPEHLPTFLGGEAGNQSFVAARAALAGMPQLFLKAGGTEERSLVLEASDHAACSVAVEGGLDIMLDCRFEGQDGTIEEVFAANRIKDKGFSFMAIKGGQLILRFDNTYSWVKPKSIQYELAKLPEEAAPETGKVDEETEEADVA